MAKKGTKNPKNPTDAQPHPKTEGGENFPPGQRARPGRGNAAAERWLQDQISRLYQEVINEPLPKEFLDLIDKYRTKNQQESRNGSLKSAPNEGLSDA